jgi:predicted signal transduction protein with EAL and GGDEF domain
LTAMHCDVGQGYHLGRPVPAADLTPRLAGPPHDADRREDAPEADGPRVASDVVAGR